MATGGEPDTCTKITPKLDEYDLKPADFDLMIRTLRSKGDYVVLSKHEFERMKTPLADSTHNHASSPLLQANHSVRRRLLPNPPGSANISRSQFVPAPVYSHEIPRLSFFSGDDPPQKGDATYDVWRYELKCIMTDLSISQPIILQAIRRSLRGTARQILIPLGETATSSDILFKFDSLFGTVVSHEAIMQTFYTENQKENESVTAFGCRLESLLQVAVQEGHINSEAKNDMLRSKFWTSLRSERLKSQTRHKFDTIKTFDLLLREIRVVEQELNTADKANTTTQNTSGSTKAKVQHQPVQAADTDNTSIQKQLDTLIKKLESLEAKVDNIDKRTSLSQNNVYHDRNVSSFSDYTGRGYYHGDSGRGSIHDGNSHGNHGITGRGNNRNFSRGRGNYTRNNYSQPKE